VSVAGTGRLASCASCNTPREPSVSAPYLDRRFVADTQGAVDGRPAEERRAEAGAQWDHLGDQRDHAAERRDESSAHHDEVGARRDQASDRRDRAGSRRDEAGMQRDLAGDRRDLVGVQRDHVADRRDEAADERDRLADVRDHVADLRDQDGDTSVMPIGGRIAADALRRSEVARHEAASDRRQASQDRRAAASERHQAERDRDTAWADRDAGADERELSRLDRGIASRDRVVGAGGRVHAERDRSTASADREASAEERDSASVDGLTGVYNRTAGLLELEREMARSRRTQQPFVLAFLDVDQLKAVNDSQGHAAGDRVLVEVSETVKSQARPYDLIIRYGGDEFLCAFSGLQTTDVTSRLALVNASLAAAPGHASITAGIATLRRNDTADDLIARADAALYRSRLPAVAVSSSRAHWPVEPAAATQNRGAGWW